AAGLLTGRLGLVLLAPVLGYGPAWIGHFVFEKNVPATFGHPLWSLRADFVMLGKMILGTMDAEVARVVALGRDDGDSTGRTPEADIPPINVADAHSGAIH